ncbi:MAG: bifunctional [glutamate--ammonia ligase]-adenylyl-L-tyrosine phosphorylase/[glutamate--ammonia-ligase] adenylyltransferase [Deltaproteobacteria bacterium]|nr:bifunctional [glutamate--ammonia ligase]-adenylyl-L-tyrosine phosphorylase/[glutamate--ammonia-ligase] adenylyltransferase [Deltaproteobacteria bacterium]
METLALIDQLILALTSHRGGALSDRQALGELPPDVLRLVQSVLSGPMPRATLINLRKVIVAAQDKGADPPWPPDEGSASALATVLAAGPDLSRLIARAPARRLALLYVPSLAQPWGREAMERDLRQRVFEGQSLDELREEICGLRNDHFVRLAGCEFGATSLEVVGRELADLADACLEVALEASIAAQKKKHGPPLLEGDLPCSAAIIGMGKYGARELNFCSDIDVIFLYASDAGMAGTRSLHEFYAAVCRDVVSLLSEPSAEGYAFRVDLRLRPEGARGPLCNSLGAAESYYEAWGGPYDRLAWLKARHAAGEAGLGESLIATLRPFVFPRALGPEVVEQLRGLSRKIRAELAMRHVTDGFDVKLGVGGIRDVEFFVQALQLLHGGRLPALQRRPTLESLEQLLFAGLISDDERTHLADAYDLYRRIEHRLQLYDGRQTHLLPDAGETREHVVAHLGYEAEAFVSELEQRRGEVSAIYATLDEGDHPEDDQEVLPLLGRDVEREDLARVLLGLGFRQASWAAGQIELLKEKPWGPLGSRPSPEAERLAIPLFHELRRSPDPDAALGHFVALSLRYGAYRGFWRLFAENPVALRLLCSVLGTSDFLAKILARQPELLDHLLLAGQLTKIAEPTQMASELSRRLALVEDADDPEQRFGVLERFHDEQMLRVGLLDIAGQFPLERVWQQLSVLAELTLGHVYQAVLQQAVSRYGAPCLADGVPATMAVLGLGKLGGAEMSYGSDLDLIFVYSGEGQTSGAREVSNHEFFTRVAQRLIRALTHAFVRGALYSVDARLRPSGSQGTLVVSAQHFKDYNFRQGQLWERQVLIKARCVAGDAALGGDLERWIQHFIFEGVAAQARGMPAEIVRLRQRIETELAGENPRFYNLKTGRGGLLDIEFLVQFWQSRGGKELPALRARATLEALEAARAAGVVDDERAKKLDVAYRFLRRLEGRLRVVQGKGEEHLEKEPWSLEVVARRLGYRQQGAKSSGEQLLDDYRETVDGVRTIFEDVLGAARREEQE